jgi:hydrogenase nickel incorporation protein HypB
MCTNCGCQGDKATVLNLQTGETTIIAGPHDDHGEAHHAHPHEHDHGAADHDHHHGEHEHGHGHSHHSGRSNGLNIVEVEARILAKNDAVAARNRAWFAGREILALNLVSAPGAGKTALLERTIRDLGGERPLYVIEGDQATANDGERIRRAGASAVQVNTGTGCHLDANMVALAVSELKPAPAGTVLIENVGNLVCPALFDLGERAKVVIFSVTDGEDKPLKYPHMFRAAAVVILSKIDLLPHLDFSLATAIDNVRQVNPNAKILELSARTGEGMSEWYDWLHSEFAAARQAVFA